MYGVREFPDWRAWAAAIEAELDRRGAKYAKIRWERSGKPGHGTQGEPAAGLVERDGGAFDGRFAPRRS